ncbi:MAG: hypothetical protein AMXMBFR61_04350 [Fimbriimonadales bacterium]
MSLPSASNTYLSVITFDLFINPLTCPNPSRRVDSILPLPPGQGEGWEGGRLSPNEVFGDCALCNPQPSFAGRPP